MTEVNSQGEYGEPTPSIVDWSIASVVAVGLVVLALCHTLAGWADNVEKSHRRRQLLEAYKRRRNWKKGDIPRLEALGINGPARMRMQRLGGLGRPVVPEQRPLEEVVLHKINAFVLLMGPSATVQERKRQFRQWPWWKHHVEAYYRGEHELAKHRKMKNASIEAEIKVGTVLGISSSAVHNICREIRRMRREDESSANFPAATLEEYQQWMKYGAEVAFRASDEAP